MTTFTHHLFASVPALWRDEANAILEARGYGPGNFSIRLTSRADGVTTHYGVWTVVQPTFLAWLQSVAAGLEGVDGADPAEVQSVVKSLRVSAPERRDFADAGRAGWEAFLAGHGLREVPEA